MFGQHSFKIHAGDFGPGDATYSSLTDSFTLPVAGKLIASQRVPSIQLCRLELATEENVKTFGGTVGWGVVGGALLGPVGLLAGLLVGGRHKKMVFAARFSDGRKFLASSDGETFAAIQSAAFANCA